MASFFFSFSFSPAAVIVKVRFLSPFRATLSRFFPFLLSPHPLHISLHFAVQKGKESARVT